MLTTYRSSSRRAARPPRRPGAPARTSTSEGVAYGSHTQAFVNERAAPDILVYETELMARVDTQVKAQACPRLQYDRILFMALVAQSQVPWDPRSCCCAAVESYAHKEWLSALPDRKKRPQKQRHQAQAETWCEWCC